MWVSRISKIKFYIEVFFRIYSSSDPRIHRNSENLSMPQNCLNSNLIFKFKLCHSLTTDICSISSRPCNKPHNNTVCDFHMRRKARKNNFFVTAVKLNFPYHSDDSFTLFVTHLNFFYYSFFSSTWFMSNATK
jgi:hypothetical protein